MFMCLCRRPGRKITQAEIYTGKMRLGQTNQTSWLPLKNGFTWSKTASLPPRELGVNVAVVHLLGWWLDAAWLDRASFPVVSLF